MKLTKIVQSVLLVILLFCSTVTLQAQCPFNGQYILSYTGSLCSTTGNIVMSGSQNGATYRLTNTGAVMTGTGGPLTWTNVNITGSTSYSVVGTVSGCTGGYTQVASTTINYKAPIVAQITSTNTLCPGGTVTYTVNVTSGTGIAYTWYRPDGSTIVNSNFNSYIASDAGTYSVQVGADCNAIRLYTPAPTVTTATVAGTVSGASSSLQGSQSTYTITGTDHANLYGWALSNNAAGEINVNGTDGRAITINWSPSFSGNVTLTADAIGTCGNVYAAAFPVSVYQPLTSGTIGTNTSQFVNYGGNAQKMTCSLASGGYGTINYYWETSPDGVNWFSNGQTTNEITPSVLTATTYYRYTADNITTGMIVHSNAAMVTVYPQLIAGTASPVSQSINYNTPLTNLIATTTSGGSGTIQYQWQQLISGVWTAQGAPSYGSTGYAPSNTLVGTTSYRLQVMSNGITTYSNVITVTVYPQLAAGTVSPASQSVGSGGGVSALTASLPGGGDGTYQYTWQMVSAGNWVDIAGTASATNNSYQPTNTLVGTTSYRQSVTSNGLTVNSNTATVAVSAPPVAPCPTAPVLVTAPMTGTYNCGEYYNGSGITISSTTIIAPGAGQSVHIYTTGDCLPLATNIKGDQNYVLTSAPRMPGYSPPGIGISPAASGYSTCDVSQTVQYIDGLGRPLQTVQIKGSPKADRDLVQPFAYDAYGREVTKYLPYTTLSNDGSYKTDALSPTGQNNFYAAPPSKSGVSAISVPSSTVIFEPSPLNRVTEQGAPGATWQPGVNPATDHTVRIVYASNDGTTYWAKQYDVAIDAAGIRTLSTHKNYDANQLYVTVTMDENWQGSGSENTTEEYKDVQGHVVLKRTFNLNAKGVHEILSTYYVYDDLGNLAFVLPPGANPDAGISSTDNQDILDKLCYQYKYDERNRLTKKRIPGKDWEYMVYNSLDQLVLSQDGQQRLTNQWAVTKYDAFGRVIATGLWNAGSVIDQATLQSSIYSGAQWDNRDNTVTTIGYNMTSYPVINKILTINYYDDYSFPGMPSGYTAPSGTGNTTGLLTASRTTVLNSIDISANVLSDMLWSVNYYDGKGRNISSYAQHYLGGALNAGNYDLLSTVYNDFTGEVTSVTRKHLVNGSQALLVANTYSYDHLGRKTQTTEQINGNSPVTLSQTEFNDIGQVLTKHIGNNIQKIDYTYNERGWLKTALAPLFAMQLNYNDVSNAQYNGNIASQYWGIPGSLTKSYTYLYDNMNRLTSGISSEGNSEQGITYDLMGDIKSLTRTGSTPNTLAYDYNSANQLTSVTDGGNPFRTYGYDLNGNAGTDGMGHTINYNLLNLPQTIPALGLTYVYDASGQKLRKINNNTSTEYISGIQYTINSDHSYAIDFVLTEEGRALNSGGGNYTYEYTLSDHLGNSRINLDQAGLVKQQDDYYPFGVEILTGNFPQVKNEYLYNKKEKQEDLNGQYDYGARFYDPVIVRFTSIDKFSEKYAVLSNYQYAANNPIKNIDIKGDSIYVVANIKKDTRIWDSFETLKRTPAGRREFEKFARSTNENIYVSGEHSDNQAVEYTYANIQKKGGFISDGELSTDAMPAPNDFKNLQGHKIKSAKSSNIIGINLNNLNKLDKYDMAFAFYHETAAHIDGENGNEYQEHVNFGNFNIIPGLGLHTNIFIDGNDYNVTPKSAAWNILEQLLELKIKDGNGTDQNKKDLEEMQNYGKKK